MGDIHVLHNQENNRFEVTHEGHLAVLDYRRRGERLIFIHTGVPAELEGQGVGSALARTGLNYAADKALLVVPYCPFVKGYIERHPEYHPLTQPKR